MNEPCLISIEFNELCPHLMDRFIDQGLLPNFARMRSESEVYLTDAEAEGEELNPWVQWVTVHTGLSHRQHKVLHLSQGHKLDCKAVWDLASDAGYRVWVCSSMNPRADLPLNGLLLPDPWSTGVRPQPAGELDPFFDYVRSAVQDHTKEGAQASAKQFLTYMLRHGLSAQTMINTARQLASERWGDARWRRAMIMDQLQFDLFQYHFRKLRPHFSTFFANSTAHFQHCYWRHMEPEKFEQQPPAEELLQYRHAILEGYQAMDRLVGKFLKLAPAEATITFATGLSQQPYLDHEQSGGRHYYHLHRPQVLSERLGLKPNFVYEPVMAEQFLLRFPSAAEAVAAKQHLESLVLDETAPFSNGNPQLFSAHISDDTSLMCQCRCSGKASETATIRGETLPSEVRLSDVFYRLATLKSARHHPDGMFWVRRPQRRHVMHQGKLPLTEVAPMMMDVLQLQRPQSMKSA